jgi:hypothetical protein
VAVSCEVAPIAPSEESAAVRFSETGIGAVWLKTMVMSSTTPLVGMTNSSLWPERVRPFSTHVARARTWPALAGTSGSTHEPSARAWVVRLSTLTVQFSFS